MEPRKTKGAKQRKSSQVLTPGQTQFSVTVNSVEFLCKLGVVA